MLAPGECLTCCCCLVAKLCLALLPPENCSLLGSSVHGILQARILEWVAISFVQGIFPTQGSNPHLLHWQADSLPLSQQGSLRDTCDSVRSRRLQRLFALGLYLEVLCPFISLLHQASFYPVITSLGCLPCLSHVSATFSSGAWEAWSPWTTGLYTLLLCPGG